MPIMIQTTHAGVLVLVVVLLSVCSSVLVLVLVLSLTSDCVTACVSLPDVVCTLFCLVLPVWRCVLVVLTGCCVPVLSGSLHVVSSTTSSTSVFVVEVSEDWNEVCASVCVAVCWVRSLFCSVCCDRAVCVAVLTVLQLTANRASTSVRAIIDFFNSAVEPAYIFT